jgi:hypothetical protein
MTPERRRLMQMTMRGEEVQFPVGECLLQVVQKQPAEHP